MARLRDRIRYRLSRAIARGDRVSFGLLAFITVAIVLLGAGAVFGLQSGPQRGILDSVFWSLDHVLDPGAFSSELQAPWPVRIVSLAISLLGMILFGTLIGFIWTALERRVANSESGAVPESNHTLILGWSQKTPLIVRSLARLGLETTVVILAPRPVQEMRAELRAEGLAGEMRRVVLRNGDPSSRYEIARMSCAEAARVIAIVPEPAEASKVHADVEVVRTLMVLTSEIEPSDGRDARGPAIVAEVSEKRSLEIADIAGRKQVPLICTTEIVGRLLAQVVRRPGLASVFASLFEAPGGAIRVRRIDGAVGRSLRDLSATIPGAVPIGVTWEAGEGAAKRTAAALNLEPDYRVDEDEQLVLLTSGADLRLGKAPPALAESAGTALSEAPLRRILILGRNAKRDEILQQLDRHAAERLTARLVDPGGVEPARDAGEEDRYERLELTRGSGSIVERATLMEAKPDAYDCVLVLADDSRADADPDAHTIMTLLLLDDLRRTSAQASWPRVVAELYDIHTVDMLPPHLADTVVVTPQIVSTLLAQIATLPILSPVYRELFSAEGMEIALRPAASYAKLGAECRFSDLVATGQASLEMVLGVRVQEPAGTRVVLAPANDSLWKFGPGDGVIVLAQQVYA